MERLPESIVATNCLEDRTLGLKSFYCGEVTTVPLQAVRPRPLRVSCGPSLKLQRPESALRNKGMEDSASLRRRKVGQPRRWTNSRRWSQACGLHSLHTSAVPESRVSKPFAARHHLFLTCFNPTPPNANLCWQVQLLFCEKTLKRKGWSNTKSCVSHVWHDVGMESPGKPVTSSSRLSTISDRPTITVHARRDR